MVKFEVGQIYQGRSVCDSNCIISLNIVSRTEKFVVVNETGKQTTKRLGVKPYNGVEQIKPWGSYSMAPIIGADQKVKIRG